MRGLLRTGARGLFGVILAASIWAMPSCIATEPLENAACKAASDCPQPYVCCSNPRIPSEDTPPLSCQDVDYCDGYLPFLVEGQPCERGLPVSPKEMPQGPCSEGLVCCKTSKLCGKAEACPAPAPTVLTSSDAPCLADADCTGGEICCGIDFFNRANGKCRSLFGCGAEVTPQPE